MRKSLALLLCAAILTSLAASCGGETPVTDGTTGVDETTTATSVDTEPADALAARKLISDELPEEDFDGAAFHIVTDDPALKIRYINQEEETGDVVDDAVFTRNRTITERFHVNIIGTAYESTSACMTAIKNNVNAGDDEIQLASAHVISMGSLALSDYFLNWCEIPHIDFSKPWWAASTSETLTYNNICPLAVGDFALSGLYTTYCMFFNQTLVEDYKLDDIYQVVMDGEWTLDYLIKTTKDIYRDVDNDGKKSDADFYGFCANNGSSQNTFLWSTGSRVVDVNSQGQLEVVYKTERVSDTITKLVNMYNDNDGIAFSATFSPAFAFPREKFLQSETIFSTGLICYAVNNFRDMDDDFGIIPYPKWDSNQTQYYTMVDGSHSILAMPVTVEDQKMCGIITEALCAESYKIVVPAYYDVALKVKGARDDTSIEVLDLLVNSRVFDLGYVYDEFKGASFIFQRLVGQGNSNFESYWASNESAIMTQYEKVIDYFENYEK